MKLTGISGGIRNLGMGEYLITCFKCSTQKFVKKKNITEVKKSLRGMLWKTKNKLWQCDWCGGNK
jgi:hypothetical protein